jgi:hypothetical protein
MVDNFQLVLFHKYAELLQRRFGEDFQEVGAPTPVALATANGSERSSRQTTTCQ